MASGRPELRSVDRECAGREIQPRNPAQGGADAVPVVEGNIEASEWQDAKIHRGRRSGMCTLGFPRNLGDLAISIDKLRSGDR